MEYVNHSEAVAILTERGDYSLAQAGIILDHARKWRKGGETIYSRQYVETCAGCSLPR